ncbi:MAG: sodium:proton antiporter [Clostridiales bacterium]|nr:sodium:proton antiporter [Clostridiales bacterium]
MKDNSQIIMSTTKLLVPISLIFGIYVIINGASGVGGGFQGGAILSVVLMFRWLSGEGQGNSLVTLRNMEKALMLLILLFSVVLIGQNMQILKEYNLDQAWLLLINILIGLKVCCGLSIIFFRFVFYEAR